MRQKYYITTAIPYASGKPHIGNTYEAILADSIARWKRYEGYDVYFQTGTDEHGQKIETKAKNAGVTPKEYADGVVGEIRRLWDLVGTSYDRFIRTTDDDHVQAVQKIFKYLYDKGDIYKGAYEGLYCVECESFFTPSQLVNGKCPDCGRDVQPAREEAYFFKMSKYADRLIDYINTHPDFIKPVSRKNEMMNNFLLPGLRDLCVSRTSFSWGIPVDFDPKHVVYVWLDALVNYITGIGYNCGGESSELFKKLWPADLHVIGKDIIRFHTIYWPIFLMALDLPLPKTVFGHTWLLQGDGKRSKSKGWLIHHDELRLAHQGAGHRKHLLLSAGERAARLPAAFLEAREEIEYPLDVSGDIITAQICADPQVLLNRKIGENAASLRHQRDALADYDVGVVPGDVIAAEDNLPSRRPDKTGNGTECGALAGTVGSDQRHDAAFLHVKGYAFHRFDAAVIDL